MAFFFFFKGLFKIIVPAKADLEETAIFEVFLDNDIRDCVKHKFDVLRVCGTGHMAVDFFHISPHVQIKKLNLDVISCIIICVGTCFWRGSIYWYVPLIRKVALFRN